jgi:sugar/nucleoside kinase (ribokinase family)
LSVRSGGKDDSRKTSPDVIVYGTVCLDRFVAVDATGDAPPDSEIHEMPGGEAFNTATALAGWGVSVMLTGTAIGQEEEGERLRFLLDTHPLGLPRTLIPDNPDAVTPVCTVRVFPDGERSMNGRGFSQAVAPPPLEDSLLSSRPLWVCDPNLGQPAVTACLQAYEAGCPVIAMDFAAEPEVVRRSRILVTSAEFLQRRQGETASPEAVVQRLVEQGAQTAIVTRGERGCVVMDRELGMWQEPAVQVEGVRDTTGAGDVFRAGLCWGMLRVLPLQDCVRFAAAAAALHCQTLGGGSRPALDKALSLAGLTDLSDLGR